MTKSEYVADMLLEILENCQITSELAKSYAEWIIDGLDAWYELSGDSVATNNRYQQLESEIIQAKQKYEKLLAEEENRHEGEKKEWERNSRWALARKQERIEELEKQTKQL